MSTFKNIMGWIWPVVVGLLIALFIDMFLSFVKVDGLSMYPNLQNNERVIMLKHAKIIPSLFSALKALTIVLV